MEIKKSKPTIQQFLSLCDYVDGVHFSKSGNDYVNALANLFQLENKNDRPFTIEDVLEQPTLNLFNFSGVKEYKFICNLKAQPLKIIKNKRTNEKIFPFNFPSKNEKEIFEKSQGVSYIITCPVNNGEYIIKIGQTRTPFKKRLDSYNCGVVNNWRTASTTNIKMLQSFLTTRLDFKLYIYDCSDESYSINWHGVESNKFASPKSLAVEDIMIKEFIKTFKKKPLANIQAEATKS